MSETIFEIHFLRFERMARHPNRKTWAWNIYNKEGGALIGQIYWYGPWRKYCFFPNAETVYEQVCLRDIADFCEQRTQEHTKHLKESRMLKAHFDPPVRYA